MRHPLTWAMLVVAGCARAPTSVVIDFDPDTLAETAEVVDVYVVASCADVTLGAVPEASTSRSVVRRGTSTALGATPSDRFGVYALARTATCEVVAAGCTDAVRGTSTVRVIVSAWSGPPCGAGEACVRGVCEPGAVDAGVPDAFVTEDAAIDEDVGVDAAIVCSPACGMGLVCTTDGCLPSVTSAARYGSFPGGGTGTCATDDGVGAVFVGGMFESQVTFAHLAPAVTLTNVGEAGDGFVVRQSGGATDWVAQLELGTSAGDRAWVYDVDHDSGGVWVTGYTGSMSDTIGLSGGRGCTRVDAGVGSTGAFLARLDDATGCVTTSTVFPGAPGRAVAARGATVYVGGAGGGTTAFDLTTVAISDTRAWIAAVQPTVSDALWIHSLRGAGDFDLAAIAATADRICVGGVHSGTFEHDDPFPDGLNGAFVECVDASGTLRWVKVTPGGRVFALAADEGNDILYAGGELEGTMTFTRPDGTLFSLTSLESQDAWVAAFRLGSGDFLWAQRFGGPYQDRTRTLSVSPGGGLYVSLSFSVSVRFDGPLGSVEWVTVDGGLALARFRPEGDLVWGRALLESMNTFPDRRLGSGLHTAHFGRDLAFVGEAPGQIDVDGVILDPVSTPFFVARYHELP